MIAKPNLKWIAAAAFCAMAFPAAAADDDWILLQMARTDGDVLGEYHKPIPGEGVAVAVALSETDLAFLAEIQRTDGHVEPVAQSGPVRERTETASR